MITCSASCCYIRLTTLACPQVLPKLITMYFNKGIPLQLNNILGCTFIFFKFCIVCIHDDTKLARRQVEIAKWYFPPFANQHHINCPPVTCLSDFFFAPAVLVSLPSLLSSLLPPCIATSIPTRSFVLWFLASVQDQRRVEFRDNRALSLWQPMPPPLLALGDNHFFKKMNNFFE